LLEARQRVIQLANDLEDARDNFALVLFQPDDVVG
jgi:hypothetical protein